MRNRRRHAEPGGLPAAFIPRPGWGGQLGSWLRTDKGRVIARSALLLAVALTAAPYIGSRALRVSPSAIPAPSPEPVIVVAMPRGGGAVHAARLALREYLEMQAVPPALEPEQALFAEDWLARRIEVYAPAPGQPVQFPRELLAAAVLKAQSLTPEERAAWSRYLK